MNLQQIEAKIKTLENSITRLNDIEEIKKLQYAYCYYLEHGMWKEVIDLFSDNTESIETSGTGVYLGKEGVRKHFSPGKLFPEFLHVILSINGIIDVDQSGETAQGRWYGLGFLTFSITGKIRPVLALGIYENEFVKENRKWKFKKLHFYNIFHTPYEDGWVKTPSIIASLDHLRNLPEPDRPCTVEKPYPSGYIVPFHYKHPISGK